MHKHLQSAINLAQNYTFDEKLGYTHACIIQRGSNILAVGYNGMNKNSYVDHLAKMSKSPAGKPLNLHAEVAAILSVRSKIDLSGAKCYVARVKPTGIGMSRPCELCQHSLKRYGIKRAYYTIDENTFGVMKL